MLHEGYAERFRAAEEETRPWGVSHGLAFDTLRMIGTGFAFAALPDVGRILDSPVLQQLGVSVVPPSRSKR